MSLQDLLRNNEIKAYTTSKREIDDLRSVIARDLADAVVAGVSTDRRFDTAYNADLQTATMALACAGYRASGKDHHRVTLNAALETLGPSSATAIHIFDLARRKRNTLDYDRAHVATETEVAQLLGEAQAFLVDVENWIAINHSRLKL